MSTQHTHTNSREAYRSLQSRGALADQYEKILDALRRHGPLTDRELCEETGMEKSSVSGRVAELLDDYRLVEDETVVCRKTGRPNRTTRPTTAIERHRLKMEACEARRERDQERAAQSARQRAREDVDAAAWLAGGA